MSGESKAIPLLSKTSTIQSSKHTSGKIIG